MLDELSRYVIAEPYPFVVDLEKSHGSYLATLDGREIFDWAGYFGAKLIGHNHPGLSEPEYLRQSCPRGQQQDRQSGFSDAAVSGLLPAAA